MNLCNQKYLKQKRWFEKFYGIKDEDTLSFLQSTCMLINGIEKLFEILLKKLQSKSKQDEILLCRSALEHSTISYRDGKSLLLKYFS